MKRIRAVLSNFLYEVISSLPTGYSKIRVNYYNKRGCKIQAKTSISPNVRIRGTFEMGTGSSIAQNCSITGENAGVFIGENVMIAPNVVIVAFDHGFENIEIPMVFQKKVEAPIYIEDNVWIASNSTIVKGVRIGEGSIVAANSLVNRDVEPFSIVGGVPAKFIRSRLKKSDG